MTQLVLPAMRARGSGRIINMSSMGGEMALPGGSAYHASKYAVEALSDVLRFEVAPFGVDVVVVQPGVVKTRFGDTAVGAEPPAPHTGPYAGLARTLDRRVRASYAPGAKGASPAEVAAVVLKAVQAKQPSTRYKVTAQARLLPATRALLTDRGWDRLMRSQFPTRGERSAGRAAVAAGDDPRHEPGVRPQRAADAGGGSAGLAHAARGRRLARVAPPCAPRPAPHRDVPAAAGYLVELADPWRSCADRRARVRPRGRAGLVRHRPAGLPRAITAGCSPRHRTGEPPW